MFVGTCDEGVRMKIFEQVVGLCPQKRDQHVGAERACQPVQCYVVLFKDIAADHHDSKCIECDGSDTRHHEWYEALLRPGGPTRRRATGSKRKRDQEMLPVRAENYNARHDNYSLEHVQQYVREQASFHVGKTTTTRRMDKSKRTSCRSRMLSSMADNTEYPVTERKGEV